jgi:hypothetical protein
MTPSGKWRRRESNPRSQESADDSGEDADLASGDGAETPSDRPHKQLGELVAEGDELTVFDFLGGSGDAWPW